MTPHEHLDVLIIGAGISGIGAARYLITEHPQTNFAVLEARSTLGGTWDLFRYPGIRSDSDLHTFGYEFKPWTDRKAIAAGGAIRSYLDETARENGIFPRIRFHQRVRSVHWSSETGAWDVQIEDTTTGETSSLSTTWIFSGTGYFRYDEGFTPNFEGRDRFEGAGGQVIHPQHWPEDLDYAGKNVVVIGSGATAVTLIPAMVEGGAQHLTMLQRTPTYVMPIPSEDVIANTLQRVLGARRGYAAARRMNIAKQRYVYAFCQRFPRTARKTIRAINARLLPKDFDVDKHFNPPYDPWDQRLCAVPDGDLFRAIREGRADVVTDQITTFTPRGIQLASGGELEADIIVTATGLNLQLFGGIDVTLDGEPFRPPEHVAYKGMMLSGVPNLAFAVGYTNSSWTLKVDLLCENFVRLLSYMNEHDYDVCVPVPPEGMETRPLLDFAAGYVQRSVGALPRQGDRDPWQMSMSFARDVALIRRGDVADAGLRFSRVEQPAAASA